MGPEWEGAALESLLESHDKTGDAVLSQDIPLLITKATGKPHGETRRGRREGKRKQEESQRGGEVNGLIERSGRRGQRATHASLVCLVLQGQVYQVRNGTVDRKICCFDLTLLRLSPPFLPSPVPLCCSHSPLFTCLILSPPSHPPSVRLAHPSSHCAG